MSRFTFAATCFTSLLMSAAPAFAQTAVMLPPPQNVLQLAASATLEVPKDWLMVTMGTTREGADAAGVQSQLKAALDTALAEARKVAKPGQLELRTGGFSIYPRYAAKGGISGWQGSAELILEGRDSTAISQLAGRLQTLTVSRTVFSLSREAREKVEAEVAASAIGRFRAQADAYAKQFGFASYAIREVNVNLGGEVQMQVPVMRMQASAAPPADVALPVEAGRANVTANVAGSVQMSIR